MLQDDTAAMGELGLARIAAALAGLFDGDSPDEFDAAVDAFLARYRHPELDASVTSLVYQPMLELLDELWAHDFTIGIVTAGGTEFVRRVSGPLYDVPAQLVVGTLIGYEFDRDDDDRPLLRRTVSQMGSETEGKAKVEHIQSQLGRAPIVAAGNTGGDREMLEWANAGRHPGLAILIDHDDADREYLYAGEAATVTDTEKITDVAARLGRRQHARRLDDGVSHIPRLTRPAPGRPVVLRGRRPWGNLDGSWSGSARWNHCCSWASMLPSTMACVDAS